MLTVLNFICYNKKVHDNRGMIMKNEKFISFFIEKRKELNYSQSKIARELGISDQAVSNWERGLTFPDLTYLDDIAKILETNVESLILGYSKKLKIKENVKFEIERFTRNLVKLRKSKQLTQNELGKILNVSGQNISKYEKSVFLPSVEMLYKYAEYFNVSFLNVYYGLSDADLFVKDEIENDSSKSNKRRKSQKTLVFILISLILLIICFSVFLINFFNSMPVEKHMVTIILDNNNVISYEVEDNESIVLPILPEKKGYTASWNNDNTMINEDSVFTVVYTPNIYKIIYRFSSDTINDFEQMVIFDKPFKLYKPEIESFLGYFYEGEIINDGMYYYDHDIVVFAVYNDQDINYTINFDTDGGSEISSITGPYGMVIDKPVDPIKEGYIFVGWDVTIPPNMPVGNLNIKALWRVKEYTITYYGSGNDIEIDKYTINDSVELPTYINTSNKIFLGWYTNSNFEGDPVMKIEKGATGDKEFYSKWYLNTFIVDDLWKDKIKDDVVVFENVDLIYGINAFSTIKQAIEETKGYWDKTINVQSGIYNDDFTIDSNFINLIGPNCKKSGVSKERVDEAVITGKVTLDPKIYNVQINGFKFMGDAQLTIKDLGNRNESITGSWEINNSSIFFENNYIDKGESLIPIINFCESDKSYNDLIFIQGCYFENGLMNDMLYFHNVQRLSITNSTFNNIHNNCIGIYDTVNGAGLRESLDISNNNFKYVNGSTIWVNYANFTYKMPGAVKDSIYFIRINENIFESVYGQSCISFNQCGKLNTPDEFSIAKNEFKDVYQVLNTVVNGANFKDNIVYLYEGKLENSFVINGGVYSDRPASRVMCDGNLFLSSDGKTIYTIPAENGFIFNEYVDGYDINNYTSIEEYENCTNV